MSLPRIDRPNLTAYFDLERRLTHVIYRGPMTADMTVDVYRWIIELASTPQAAENSEVRGSLYDFREVTDFQQYSLSTVQRESRQLSFNIDVSKIPVALLVNSLMQEQMVSVGMKITTGEHRKRIVHSEEAAFAFFEEFHTADPSASD
jgi:hypothetical protein